MVKFEVKCSFREELLHIQVKLPESSKYWRQNDNQTLEEFYKSMYESLSF